MNKITLSISILAILLSILTFYSTKSSELVYVDVNKLIDGYDRTKIEKAKFEEKAKLLQSNVDSLISNWQQEIMNYEKERSSMTPKELELKQEILSNKQQQINNYQHAIQQQIQEEDQKATQTVVNDINNFVKEFGKKNSYKIIFGATGGGSIMYADDSSDLTEIILEGLNKEYKGE